ncbi:DUF2955 domain-containing protein [Bordetella flabilis]|uniref:DUF2955 domain-containing protein n=1 Tax=Bordetella flabilis TaxID=463014 RepID=A0A193G8U4_9BORD|nr:DUF2955 domain-containing protein [Bordetella flabilis]ANN76407.1 hypothetical protein BAU07_04100 [Bordetella flabilis]
MSTDSGLGLEERRRGQRALRLGTGTALSMAVSFGLDLPVPMIAPVLAAFVLAMLNRPLSFKATLGLLLMVLFTTGSGLLLIPLLRHYAFSGVLVIALCLFLAFRYGLRGGNNLVSLFLVIGLTMISAAGTVAFELALLVVGALVKGLSVALLAFAFCHWLFPEPPGAPALPAPPVPTDRETGWMAWRAVLVVLPAYLLALSDPMAYLPVIMKSVSLGRQSCTTTVRGAVRELLGSTLLAGLLAILFWGVLGLVVNLWMFFVWTLLFGLSIGRKLYGSSPTRQPPSFWLNTLVTMIILLGQSVQDSLAGKDVYTAFAVRMGLFIAVSLYAWLMLVLLEQRRREPRSAAFNSP